MRCGQGGMSLTHGTIRTRKDSNICMKFFTENKLRKKRSSAEPKEKDPKHQQSVERRICCVAKVGQAAMSRSSNESEVFGMVVAVRIKPLDDHEEDLSVQAVGNNLLQISTTETKTYHFDFVHWSTRTSHDSPGYVSQEMVFESIGQPIVQNSSLGYNCSLFAYGQTVSLFP
jgi:hypothetical protein